MRLRCRLVLIQATFLWVSQEPKHGFLTDDPCHLERYCADLKEEIEFMVEKLPEGEQGRSGYDDGEGDD